MALAGEAGLPVEAVSSAADFFVRKILDWREQLVPVISARATIYRPTATHRLASPRFRRRPTPPEARRAALARVLDAS